MYINPDSSFLRDSQNAANFVISMARFYSSVRKICNKVITISLGIPIIVFAFFFLLRVNRKLRKFITKDIDLNISNYKELKILQKKYNRLSLDLDSIKNVNINKVPFLLRGVILQIKILSICINKFNISLNNRFAKLDKANDGIFINTPEDVLWKNRVQVYDYLA